MSDRTLLVVLAATLVARPAAIAPVRPGHLPRGRVVHVVDGDTVDVRLGPRVERVRLIGIDAPEAHDSAKLDRDARRSHRSKAAIEAMGRRATEFTARRLGDQTVELEFDVERRDRYGRLLAYLWLPDGRLFNAEILREGYAHVLTIPPNVRYASHFRALQREARATGRGLWSASVARRARRHQRQPSELRQRQHSPDPRFVLRQPIIPLEHDSFARQHLDGRADVRDPPAEDGVVRRVERLDLGHT